MIIKTPKQLTVFSLVMITVVAVDSLRALPIGAQYGFSLIFYYLIAVTFFFIPAALVAAELATGWPEQGGIYVWVREAFGKKIAFLTIWLQWFYNICWFPTILSLVAASFAYCINPQLVASKIYMLAMILSLFWLVTFINFFGMKISSILINISAIVGTIVPIIFIIILGLVWVVTDHPIEIEISRHSFFPDLTSINNLVLLTSILFGLLGMENAAAHAQAVQNPQRDYPKAMFWATIIILFTLVFGSLAIGIIVPVKELNIISGLLQAFEIFFQRLHLTWFMPILAILIAVGALGGLNVWILSPSQGLLMASRDGSLPKKLCQVNRHGVATTILIVQGIIFTVICSIFLLLPTVNSSYWALSVITSILSLIVYIPMFMAALYLRYKLPDVPRAYKIPGGNIGMWIVCIFGLSSCIFTIVLGFLPPSQIEVGKIVTYKIIIFLGVAFSCLLPFLIYKIFARDVNMKSIDTSASPVNFK